MTATSTVCLLGFHPRQDQTRSRFNSVVTSDATYNVKNTDRHIYCSLVGAQTVNLPGTPIHGEMHRIKDSSGGPRFNNLITISGNGHTIDGQTTQVISGNYGYLAVAWNETEWSIM